MADAASQLADLVPPPKKLFAENFVSWRSKATAGVLGVLVAPPATQPVPPRPAVTGPPPPEFLKELATELAASDTLFFQHRYADAFLRPTPEGPFSLAGYSHAYEAIHLWIQGGGDFTPELDADAKHAALSGSECLHRLQLYVQAAQSYAITVLGNPVPITLTVEEIAYVWLQWSTLALDWGDALFRNSDESNNDLQGALDIYQSVVTVTGGTASVPPAGASPLYDIPALQAPAAQAAKIIQNLPALLKGQTTAQALDVNPTQAAVIVQIYQQIIKIQNGLDFWGHYHNTVPIWTFDYLQSAAINFAQFAVNAERDFISFQERSDQGSATRRQLEQLASQAQAEVDAATAQENAVTAEAQAYSLGADLANRRRLDAQKNADEYAQTSALEMQFDAMRSQIGGGDGQSPEILNKIADEFMAGGKPNVGDDLKPSSDLFGVYSRNNVSAGAQLASAKVSQQYEVDSLQRTAGQMAIAADQAAQEAAAAEARTKAANAATAVAMLHRDAAQQNLQAFDAQTFTPDVWQHMADSMFRLYRRYLDMAVKTALLMQQAYNFETDQSLRFIKKDYSTDEVKGLLGADALMADIQSFTYDLITSTTGKSQPVRQTISLAQRYAYLFEHQFRRTGVMEFETRIDDFDYVYPGTYAGRIESVGVELVGLVPPNGVSGTLTNSGISAYRTPATSSTPDSSGLKYRVQTKETLVLSDYAARVDSGLIPADQRMKGIFQGAGLVSSWRLELPPEVNDIDYGALLDVRLTFYYKARYDPDLHAKVIAELAARPGIQDRQRGIQLRWIYPDAFFHFQDTGVLALSQRVQDFPSNETQPVIKAVGAVVATDGTVSPQGLTVKLATPGTIEASATTDASGFIDSRAPGSAWASLVGGSALGDYTLTMAAIDNPGLVIGGELNLTPIVNIALVLGYSFTAKSSPSRQARHRRAGHNQRAEANYFPVQKAGN
jgi:hypothetical protein